MPADVLHILGSALPDGTSIADIVRQLAGRIDPSRYRIHACFLRGDGPLTENWPAAAGAVYAVKWASGMRDPRGALEFARRLPKRPWRIVHVHFGGRSVWYLASRLTGAKLVIHLHGIGPEWNHTAATQFRLPRAATVIAVAQAVADGARDSKVHVVYPGVDLPTEGLQTQPSHGGPVIGFAGRLVPVKGLVHLIRSLPLVHRDVPTCRLEIAGAGPEESRLRDEAARLNVGGALKFLGWQADLSRSLKQWDVLVQPSLSEGMPLAVLRAMSWGLPVVATEVGGLPEAVRHGESGWIVPSGDPQALAARITQLLLDPQVRAAMGGAARARAEESFSVEEMVRRISNIYDRLLQEQQGSVS